MSLILSLAFSLTGLGVGFILAKIAPEELHPAKKYIAFAYWLFLILSVISLATLLYSVDFIPLVATFTFLYFIIFSLQSYGKRNKA